VIAGLPAALARRQARAYLRGMEPGDYPGRVASIIVMAQPLSPSRLISEKAPPAGRTPSVPTLVAASLAGLVLIATLALWFHYGTQVFFETIRTGLSACF